MNLKLCRGKFRLGLGFVDRNPEAAKKIMGKCIITHAEMILQENCMEYHALSEELFREEYEDYTVPIYHVTTSLEDGEIKVYSREAV